MRSMGLLSRDTRLLCASGLVFNLAFFIPDLGFLILLFLWLLIKAQPKTFFVGFLLGTIIFVPHFHWMLYVAWHHSQAPWWLCVIGYTFFMFYCAATSGVWCLVTGRCVQFLRVTQRWLRYAMYTFSMLSYWIFVEHFFAWPLGIPLGYPFLNPCIPLAQYGWFLKSVSFLAALWSNQLQRYELGDFIYIAPVTNKVLNTHALWAQSPDGVGQKIYQALTEPPQDAKILVSPESMFPLSLNRHPEIVKLWRAALNDGQNWLLGSLYNDGNATYQVIYWLHGSLIKNFYVKKKLTPLAEYLPRLWKRLGELQGLFLCDVGSFSVPSGTLGVEYFDITPTMRIIPRICLEFFYSNSLTEFNRYRGCGNVVVCTFVNDSWFPARVLLWMKNLTQLKSRLANLPVLFVGHFSAINYALC